MSNGPYTRLIIGLISVAFILWAGVFIWRSSVVINGTRYFSLFDDAMISMRYAWNFSHGRGLVWNPGEYVEGITNFLMTMLMSVGTILFNKPNAVLFVQVAGIPLTLAVCYLSMRIGRRLCLEAGIPNNVVLDVLFFIAGLAFYPLVWITMLGMETGLLSVLVLWATLIALSRDKQAVPSPLLAVLLGLAFMTRPDALIPAGLILLYRWLRIAPQKKGGIRCVLIEGAILAVFVVGLSAFRLAYYGSVVPNTYTLKMTGMPLPTRLDNGLGFVLPFLALIAAPSLIVIAYSVSKFRWSSVLLAALFFSSVLYQIWVGGDPWRIWRMMSPFVPLLLVLLWIALYHFLFETKLPLPVIAKGGIFVVLGLVILLWANHDYLEHIIRLNPDNSDDDNNVRTAIALNDILPPDATILVWWAGAIPYYTEFKALDALGKSDKYIAQLPPDLSGAVSWLGMSSVPGHNKYDLDYSILKLQPTYTQFLSWGHENVQDKAANYKSYTYNGIQFWLNTAAKGVVWSKLTPQ